MNPRETQTTLSLSGVDLLPVFGQADANLRAIERRFGVELRSRGANLAILGPAVGVRMARAVLDSLVRRVRSGAPIGSEDLEYLFSAAEDARERVLDTPRGSRPGAGDLPASSGASLEDASSLTDGVVVVGDKKVVKVRSVVQAEYVEAMLAHDIVFGIGPAGTGKTYLAVAMAVRYLREKVVEKIVLTRPAVEAGERLGYLPGDLQEKVDPYLRPLYDALHDMIAFEKLQRFLQLGVIEVVPLAYMRGRTLSRAFVILDEAQNTTLSQMKMFLTRLGPGSKAAVTGDVTQIDLDDPEASGLVRIVEILENVRGIEFVYFGERDVVRHQLVREIIRAFDRQRPDAAAPGDEEAPIR